MNYCVWIKSCYWKISCLAFKEAWSWTVLCVEDLRHSFHRQVDNSLVGGLRRKQALVAIGESPLFKRFFILKCIYVYLSLNMWVQVLAEARSGYQSENLSERWLWASWCGFWGLNSATLQRQQVMLTTELSLQPLGVPYYSSYRKWVGQRWKSFSFLVLNWLLN